ncbi:histidine-specific methyltransferase [Cyathus striatus]|nr:histidine-specific methyltransferase [Cyathus striatus]
MTDTIQILDIRRSKSSETSLPNLHSLLIEGLSNAPGNRSISSEVLYDTVGLGLFNHGIKNDWPSAGYYPIIAEKDILRLYADDVAAELGRDNEGRAVIIELGAGSLEKTSEILSALAKTVQPADIPPITYYALDLDRPSIIKSINELQSQIGQTIRNKIATKGMWGTYDDAFHLFGNDLNLQSTLNISPEVPMHILFLGGTIGNLGSKCYDDIAFLKSLALKAGRGDKCILGIDRVKDKNILEKAYSEHLTTWMMYGLGSAGRVLGNEGLFEERKWEWSSCYNVEIGRIELGYRATEAHKIRIPDSSLEVDFVEDEVIIVMFSNKYTDEEISHFLACANTEISKKWVDTQDLYYLLSLRPSP